MITRPLTKRDLPELLGMMRDLCAFHGDTCAMGLAEAQEVLIDRRWLVGLIAEAGGTPVGYAVLELKWNPTLAGSCWDIAHLFVKAPLRGTGIGTALVAAAKAEVLRRGADRLTIGTAPTNAGAAAAYRAMGLQEVRNLPGARFDVPLARER